MRELLFKLYKFKLLKRIIPSILKRINKLFIKSYITIHHDSFKLKLNLNNPIDREIFLTKKYEDENIFFLKSLIKKNNIKYFFDIGAQMGFYSLNMASTFPKLFIASFEPIESNFNQLKSNVELNNLGTRIKVYKKILSNKSEKMKMWVSDKKKTGGFSVYDEKDQEIKKYDASKITYEFSFSERLDNIYKIKNEKIALKIDVERHEKYVIMGAEKIFKNNKVILQIEIFDQQKQEVESMLNKMNFYFIKSNEKDNFYSNFNDSFNNI